MSNEFYDFFKNSPHSLFLKFFSLKVNVPYYYIFRNRNLENLTKCTLNKRNCAISKKILMKVYFELINSTIIVCSLKLKYQETSI